MLFRIVSVLVSVACASLVPPSQDSFYQPTGDWQSQQPGAILAHRSVPNPLLNLTYSAAYQLLYRTVDALSNPLAAVTTVIIPPQADYSKLLSYQVVYDTPDVDCSPSYAMQEGGFYIIDEAFSYGLSLGWIVNAPDYEGPNAAFTNGIISGQATLDSIRAALASTSITKLESNATTVLWGYSGGALASEWASELQPTYAPELTISGAAMGGTTPNVTSVAISVNNAPSSGLISAAILGIAAAYPNITSVLNASFVSAADKAAFYGPKTECISQIGLTDGGKDILGYFTEGVGILDDPRVAFAVRDGGIMGIHGIPAKSNRLFVYKSILDEVSPVADTDALVEKYCKAGVNIKYVKRNYGTHSEEAVNGGLDALEFLGSIMAGTYQNEACLVETVNSAGSVIASSTIAAAAGVATASATGTSYAPAIGTKTVIPSSSSAASITALPTGSALSSVSVSVSSTSTPLAESSSGAASGSSTVVQAAATSTGSSSVPTYTGAAVRGQSFGVELGFLAAVAAVFSLL